VGSRWFRARRHRVSARYCRAVRRRFLDDGCRAAAAGWDAGYRPYRDGLRAVAVYLVVLFHAGSDRLEGASFLRDAKCAVVSVTGREHAELVAFRIAQNDP
jgi:hypothetical protein